ncbi:hypothetical protein AF60_04770 [Streptococcus uberis S6261]|uniref:Uncharacterized protein n=1 Tax=Streptococcus uberis (strain ATCC BAA-854 / 0140J) TaxID=218495 RepID=B9DTP7_STRU0|nr:hypothetical protein AF64_01790 [Streptococcus uberis C9359]KKF44413.1 hypothetical protein AF61_04680 [Streptococcus uberis EF20/0145]KKF44712.1 hypothetical protein AF63_01785 [Streptococcus uberis Ab71]KKF46615.1 hypothetical protein AF62_02100 [Streptococcus uberis C8329]KKF48494.1 hypothetical protein AF59_04700 [Streptococcus uberis C5072]KKF51085.1 hypothetical protein AF60_04770 [Streptococcus uberis S6261]KKF53434.1 hypothetical protein AF65_01860 [Streptococcus uberis C5388]KKF5
MDRHLCPELTDDKTVYGQKISVNLSYIKIKIEGNKEKI